MADNANERTFIVKNRSTSRVVYQIPSLNIRREFAPGEAMRISQAELKKFIFEPGARSLIANFLQIEAEEVLQEFNINAQPEYFLNEQQIKDLLLTGSYDAFLDCLDFAPIGVLDLVKSLAVSLPLSDYKKRQALKDKIGFDVDAALANKKREEEEAAEGGNSAFKPVGTTERPKAQTPATPTRRTSVNYKTNTTENK